jgi:hypothetical protein
VTKKDTKVTKIYMVKLPLIGRITAIYEGRTRRSSMNIVKEFGEFVTGWGRWELFFTVTEILLDEAVKFDPYWSKEADGRYRTHPGSPYDTPEELVAAFLDAAGDDIMEMLSKDTQERLVRSIVRVELYQEINKRVASGELVRELDDGRLRYSTPGF